MQAADQEGWGRRVVAVRLAWDCGWDLSKTTEPETHQFVQGGRPSSSLTRLAGWSDDLSCAALGFATATTILYHIVDAALGRKGIVEGEAVRSELARCAGAVHRGSLGSVSAHTSMGVTVDQHRVAIMPCHVCLLVGFLLLQHHSSANIVDLWWCRGECRTKHAAPCRKLFIQGG